MVIIPRCSICNHESHLIKSQIVHIRAPKEPVLRGTLLIQVASYVSWVEKPSGLWANVFSRRIQPYLPPLELFSGLPSSPCWSSNVWLGVSWPAEKNFKVSSRTLASPLTPLGSKKIRLKWKDMARKINPLPLTNFQPYLLNPPLPLKVRQYQIAGVVEGTNIWEILYSQMLRSFINDQINTYLSCFCKSMKGRGVFLEFPWFCPPAMDRILTTTDTRNKKNNYIFSCRRSQGSSRNHFSCCPRLLVKP